VEFLLDLLASFGRRVRPRGSSSQTFPAVRELSFFGRGSHGKVEGSKIFLEHPVHDRELRP